MILLFILNGFHIVFSMCLGTCHFSKTYLSGADVERVESGWWRWIREINADLLLDGGSLLFHFWTFIWVAHCMWWISTVSESSKQPDYFTCGLNVYFTYSKTCGRSSADACAVVSPRVTSWAKQEPENVINWNRHSRKAHWGSQCQAEWQLCVASETQKDTGGEMDTDSSTL